MSRPNLFAFGRSELSQDAFLCWLLAWADASHEAAEPAHHAAGRAFLAALFRTHALEVPGPSSVTVRQQLCDCDIVVELGESHVLVIEDKVDATNRNRLAEYRARIEGHYPGRTVVCVFLKTGDQSHYEYVCAQGWTVFGRDALLDVLRAHRSVSSDIFRDYLARLEAIEAETRGFRTAPLSAWSRRAWAGFFLALQEELPGAWWSYVPNPSGGFMCFNYAHRPLCDGMALFPQLEEHRLVLKLHVPDKARRSAERDAWVRRLVSADGPWRRPGRLGHGAYMSVAESAEAYRQVDGAGRLVLDETSARLKQVAAWIAALDGARV
ncbi:MAG: hypothetical protein R3F59_25610 [Myxococcota bacterium]